MVASLTKERRLIAQRLWPLVLCSLGACSLVAILLSSLSSPRYYPSPSSVQPSYGEEAGCDLFRGRWVRDENEPAYTSTGCRWIPDWKNCFKHGREDVDFVKWRWKPEGCELPRFEPAAFLKLVRDKRMMFVGDSVARNHMESLLCLLSPLAEPTETEDEVEKEDFRTFYYESHNFTIIFLRSTFLVTKEEIVANGSATGTFNLHLDRPDQRWVQKLPGTHYMILSGAHWFFRKNYLYELGHPIGCVHCNEPDIPNLGMGFAVRRAFRAALSSINRCDGCKGLLTVVRTFSPAHFENGGWNTGGYCNRTRPAVVGEVKLEGVESELREAQAGEGERAEAEGQEKGGEKRFRILDVTRAMAMRPDGHPGTHWDDKWMKGVSDCLHWCLPGPIDSWNDWLLALLRD